VNIEEFLEHARREAQYLQDAGRGPQAHVVLTLSEMVDSLWELSRDLETRTVTPAGFYPEANAAAAAQESTQDLIADEIQGTSLNVLESRQQ
jgi:acyl-CoA synthetase (AMP-forming)/AMP-acid ligase II